MQWLGWGEREGKRVTAEFVVSAKSDGSARDQVREKIEEQFDHQGIIAVHVRPLSPAHERRKLKVAT